MTNDELVRLLVNNVGQAPWDMVDLVARARDHVQVLIFCENKSDVDDVHEYLLLKAVEAAVSVREDAAVNDGGCIR